MSENDAVEGLRQVQESIRRSASDYDRDPASITLVAVSKTFPAEAIAPVLAAGQRVFGENYVQEAKAKWPRLRDHYPDVELHMIGPLQSNKAREAVELFDVIHTLDRPSLAESLAKEIARQGKKPRLLVQVNTGEEPQKSGIVPGDLTAFMHLCREELKLEIAGLMAIPPEDDDVALHAALLAKLAASEGVAGLSIGMSGDYETAIRFGATCVRVGTAIFGARA
jgi:pyridoxal phosphate enzyme (YggS family)